MYCNIIKKIVILKFKKSLWWLPAAPRMKPWLFNLGLKTLRTHFSKSSRITLLFAPCSLLLWRAEFVPASGPLPLLLSPPGSLVPHIFLCSRSFWLFFCCSPLSFVTLSHSSLVSFLRIFCHYLSYSCLWLCLPVCLPTRKSTPWEQASSCVYSQWREGCLLHSRWPNI